MTMSEPKPRPRLLFVWCLLTLALLSAFVGALGGYTGVIRSEYLAGPGNQAIIVGAIWFVDGLQLGLVIGGLIDILRWWLWKMKTRD
jgi:hypothetical protein